MCLSERFWPPKGFNSQRSVSEKRFSRVLALVEPCNITFLIQRQPVHWRLFADQETPQAKSGFQGNELKLKPSGFRLVPE